MRKKLDINTKRSKIIGIKVKPETQLKLKYLCDIEAEPLSTYINKILEEHIASTTKLHKLNWEEILKEEKNGNI